MWQSRRRSTLDQSALPPRVSELVYSGMLVQILSSSLEEGSKLRDPSPTALVLAYNKMLRGHKKLEKFKSYPRFHNSSEDLTLFAESAFPWEPFVKALNKGEPRN
ncbi:hypothetical protein TNCV_2331911 [Trichonephila clavipes]|nr:hypothetical protein TNCV_2331911 [Trichonephila clavipes]